MVNEIIAESLAAKLIDLEYVTRSAGCITVINVPVKGGPDRKFPAAKNIFLSDSECLPSGDYKDLVPNSKELGIVYLESVNAKRVENLGRRSRWKGILNLVGWFQIDEICGNIDADLDLNAIKCEVAATVSGNILPAGKIFGGKISVTEVPGEQQVNPFAKYSYNDSDSRYMVAPYGYFVLKIEYFVYTSLNCC